MPKKPALNYSQDFRDNDFVEDMFEEVDESIRNMAENNIDLDKKGKDSEENNLLKRKVLFFSLVFCFLAFVVIFVFMLINNSIYLRGR
jgi:hypothetical protein